jgi:hypothetical protein
MRESQRRKRRRERERGRGEGRSKTGAAVVHETLRERRRRQMRRKQGVHMEGKVVKDALACCQRSAPLLQRRSAAKTSPR